jgi:hypothetical protein
MILSKGVTCSVYSVKNKLIGGKKAREKGISGTHDIIMA